MSEPIGREVSPGHRIISASMLPDQIVECPHCASKNFVLVGDFHRSFEQVVEEGKPKEGGLTLGVQATQTLEGMVCSNCNIHTIIEDEEVFSRESLIFDLHTQIAAMQGRVQLPPVKEYKN